MKKIELSFVLVLLLSACGPAPKSQGEVISGCSATMDAFSTLVNGYTLPAYFQTDNSVKQGGELDVMQFFVALNHLSMQPGYVLDYVYHHDGMAGYPVMYVRPAGEPPFATEVDVTTSDGITNFLDFVRTDDTPDSYFQFVVLATRAEQFYLDWHANYNDVNLVCNKTDVKTIVKSLDGSFGYRISLTSRLRAYLLSGVEPSVVLSDLTAEVRLVTFTRWGGFFQDIYTITRSEPHVIQNVEEKILVPYECGVMF